MDVNEGRRWQNNMLKKDSNMHFEGSFQKMLINNTDLKDIFGGVKKGN